jgi:LDH2 family malate/lactate/ureidoglycolate dehydrogenase
MSLEDFKERMDYLYSRVVGCEKMAGVDRIFFPGEIEQLQAEKRLAEGIPYTGGEIEALNAEAVKVGAHHLEVMGPGDM